MIGTFAAVGFEFGQWLDTVLMQCPLGPGASIVPYVLTGHEMERAINRSEHPVKLMPAPDDQPGRGNHAVDSLSAGQWGIFFDPVDRDFTRSAKH